MATSQTSTFLQHFRRAVLLQDGAGLTDGQLLADYVGCHDEAAFAALVRRHGPMVWGVCRRVLGNHHDAEDAFQATFLVLVRKAASLGSAELVANWLYGVAHQTALKARATGARRKGRERQVAEMPQPAVADPDRWHDLQPLLDEELSHLPDRYRAVLVLCDLERKTRKEAARQLGCPEGTVAGRLARARVMLAGRLARRGLTLSVGTLAAALAQGAASAGVSPALVSSTLQAASLFAPGQAAAQGLISAKVIALTQGVLKAMFLTKAKIAAAFVLLLVSLSGGAGLIYQTQAAQDTPGKEKNGRAIQRADAQIGEKGAELQRRVRELEEQIQALASEVKALQKKLDTSTAQTPPRTEARTFHLNHRSVEEVAQTLWDMYRSKAGKEIRIGMHNPTNTLIVVASSNDLDVVTAIVTQLDKLPKKERNEDKAGR
jgi:RNA polymerase sigma factor (sigma-70 family)